MGEMNHKRAAWARKALDAFAKETGQDLRHEMRESIGDLICDLLHVANQTCGNVEAIHQHALDMYEGEVADDE